MDQIEIKEMRMPNSSSIPPFPNDQPYIIVARESFVGWPRNFLPNRFYSLFLTSSDTSRKRWPEISAQATRCI